MESKKTLLRRLLFFVALTVTITLMEFFFYVSQTKEEIHCAMIPNALSIFIVGYMFFQKQKMFLKLLFLMISNYIFIVPICVYFFTLEKDLYPFLLYVISVVINFCLSREINQITLLNINSIAVTAFSQKHLFYYGYHEPDCGVSFLLYTIGVCVSFISSIFSLFLKYWVQKIKL